MDTNLKNKLTAKIEEIESVLIKLMNEKVICFPNISIAGGLSGISLFFFYRYKQTEDEKYLDIAVSILEDILSHNLIYHPSALCGGLGGLGWLIEHVVKNEFIETDTDEVLNSVDDKALPTMTRNLEIGYYDFLHGAVGIGYYFLNRKKNDNKDKNLSIIVRGLNEISVKKGDFVMWKDYDYKQQKTVEGRYNLGLSHGIPSIMAFLSKVSKYGVEKKLAHELAEKAGDFILSCEIQRDNNFMSKFPYSYDLNDSKNNISNSRLAWCYGDLGIALSLWITGKNLGIERFQNKAIEIINASINRKDLVSNLVHDAGICHGSVGISHIYKRFYWETNNEDYKKMADYWMQVSLNLLYHEDGIAGFKAYKPKEDKDDTQWENGFGILEGLSGVGLCMISALIETPTNWDEWLMIS